jgi:hypothetical protein
MHGAGGGAPKGNKNALRNGLYTAEAIAARQAIRALLRENRDVLERWSWGLFLKPDAKLSGSAKRIAESVGHHGLELAVPPRRHSQGGINNK